METSTTIDVFGNSAEGQWSAIGSEKRTLNLRIIQIRVEGFNEDAR